MDTLYRISTGSAPIRLDLASELESQTIQSSLGAAQWTLHGRRNRIFILVSGSGTMRFEDEETPLVSPCLVWVPTGKPAMLTLNAGSRGAWLAIGDAALGQVALPGNIAEDVRRLAARAQLGTRIEARVARQLADLLSTIEMELLDASPGAQEMIRHQLVVVCIMLWRVSDLVPLDSQPAPRTIVGNFLQLVDMQMRNHWSVGDYARYLGVSTDRLNSAVQRATGRAPLTLIHARLMTEARQMLESSGMQISEIAVFLGFEDPAYFSRFFKRLSGKSPRRYRADFTQSQTRISGSFAAWP